MAARICITDDDFEPRFAALLDRRAAGDGDVDRVVAAILAAVRESGDQAVIDYTLRFDGVELTATDMRVPDGDGRRAREACDAEALEALEFAARRIEAFHRHQVPGDFWYEDATGVGLGYRWTPVAAVGIYVPGGSASYPSSVLMNAIPARIAGVGRLVMTVPAPGGELSPLVLAAADLAGVDEIYRIGGAQAIAALAYGTETVAAVDKIVGPGNAYVAAAKRQVFGNVGIDMIAGPTEIVVVSDRRSDPAWIAADLLAQAEHDEAAQSILITDDPRFADRVEAEVESQLEALERGTVAGRSWHQHGAVIVVDSLGQAAALIDRIAPEHLEIATDDPHPLAQQVRNAGAIFLGRHTPEAIGDYVAGPNHVLPTAGTARFASGLSVFDFLKRTTLIECNADSLRAIGPAAVTLAGAEGLSGHARSVSLRTGKPAGD